MTPHEIDLMAMFYAKEELAAGGYHVADVRSWAREAAAEAAKPHHTAKEAMEYARYATDLFQWVAAKERGE